VNWHLTTICNYKCRFCFMTGASVPPGSAQEHDAGLPSPAAHRLLRLLKAAGARKITYSGGELTLCRKLPDLVQVAKSLGLTVMLVSNSTGITRSFLREAGRYLDAVKLSVESNSSSVEARMGRGSGRHVEHVLRAADCCRRAGVRLMVNTVVTSENWMEDLHQLIRTIGPTRWKVFQVLKVAGENEGEWSDLSVTDAQFAEFVSRHRDLGPVAEDNHLMTGSYAMLDPWGRFFQHDGARYVYSRSVLEVGVMEALGQVGWSQQRFLRRGGRYELESLDQELSLGAGRP